MSDLKPVSARLPKTQIDYVEKMMKDENILTFQQALIFIIDYGIRTHQVLDKHIDLDKFKELMKTL